MAQSSTHTPHTRLPCDCNGQWTKMEPEMCCESIRTIHFDQRQTRDHYCQWQNKWLSIHSLLFLPSNRLAYRLLTISAASCCCRPTNQRDSDYFLLPSPFVMRCTRNSPNSLFLYFCFIFLVSLFRFSVADQCSVGLIAFFHLISVSSSRFLPELFVIRSSFSAPSTGARWTNVSSISILVLLVPSPFRLLFVCIVWIV